MPATMLARLKGPRNMIPNLPLHKIKNSCCLEPKWLQTFKIDSKVDQSL